MTEYIRRDHMRNTIRDMYHRCDTDDIKDYRDLLLQCVKDLPSADVRENVKGEWIEVRRFNFQCSECKQIIEKPRGLVVNFCPNCAADMRGDADE